MSLLVGEIFHFFVVHECTVSAIMKLFINEKPVRIVSLGGHVTGDGYNVVLTNSDEILSKKLQGKVLVNGASLTQIDTFLRLTEIKKLKKLASITFNVLNKEAAAELVKDRFKIIKAAGGVVRKGDKYLMIFRLKKWDLPKGKLKKMEDSRAGARREVEEECSIRVEVKDKICSTWHSYTRGKRMLKKTDWYEMVCLDDSGMKPQLIEDIQEVRWMDLKDVQKALKNSYGSIEQVFSKYEKV